MGTGIPAAGRDVDALLDRAAAAPADGGEWWPDGGETLFSVDRPGHHPDAPDPAGDQQRPQLLHVTSGIKITFSMSVQIREGACRTSRPMTPRGSLFRM